MAERIIIDLRNGNQATKTINGWRLVRNAIVTGVEGEGFEKVFKAEEALAAAEPPIGPLIIGSQHPYRALSKLIQMDLVAVDPEKVKFALTYQDYGFAFGTGTKAAPARSYNTIQRRASLIQAEVGFDSDRKPLQVSYTYPVDYEVEERQGKTETQNRNSTIMIPCGTRTITQIEYEDPEAKEELLGKVNSGGWVLAPFATAETWLFADMDSPTKDGGETYEVTYTFQEMKNGWNDNLVAFVDPRTGAVPGNVIDKTTGNILLPDSAYKPRHYVQADFNLLGITIAAG